MVLTVIDELLVIYYYTQDVLRSGVTVEHTRIQLP